ncbi:DUF1707 SHOCT-like domain-containing protein [Spirilliplanes yamanashiensis]|uniref:DUF1707 domain-containing protein n=1 Tax=Spirilliplanes yamanashiensis TaxID=42233 RepID=A0A8J3YCJ7_9ACTN|nr:DUF1707 domain-containing protein [Spirilliplanes yamanashiensis]MDP9816664.1 hypothetical protein [Spirilliplanes yamanashiensis]GIJ06186.1 hypothetical protein Sya03_55380 [Spirilliplanes yamanashiensis]
MTGAGDTEPTDLRIGVPERQLAIEALESHLTAQRLDPAEFEQRVDACDRARTRAELLRVFADLPAPHPPLPPAVPPPAEPDDDDIPPAAVAGCLTLGLGIPVAVVFGIVYGAWWTLAVPVAVTVVMSYAEHLRGPRGGAAG